MARKGRKGKQPKRAARRRAAVFDDGSDDGDEADPAEKGRSPRHEPAFGASFMLFKMLLIGGVAVSISQLARVIWRLFWLPLLQQERSGRGAAQAAETATATSPPTSPTRAYTVSGERRVSDARIGPRCMRRIAAQTPTPVLA